MHAAEPRSLRALAFRQEGSVTIVVALLLVVFIVVAALVVDIANARQTLRAAQAGADAAALAGARDLMNQATWATVIADVQSYASANFSTAASSWSACVDPGALAYQPDLAHLDSCISADSSVSPTKLRVQLPVRQVPTSFGLIAGRSTIDVAAAATARIVTGAACALCVLDPQGNGVFVGNGNGTVNVTGAGVIVNSTSLSSASMIGNAVVQATAIGGPSAPAGFHQTGNSGYTPAPIELPPVADPLASVLACPSAGTPSPCPTTTFPDVKVTSNGSQTLSPGVYGSISASGNGSLTMEPGTYVITNSLSFSGNGTLTANGVTLYFACSLYPTPCAAGQAGGSFSLIGNGSTSVTPPTSGPFQGLSIFADRNNTGASSLSGNGNLLSGTIYTKSADLGLSGNGTLSLDSLVVADSITLSGNGTVDLAYSQSQNANVTGIQLVQ